MRKRSGEVYNLKWEEPDPTRVKYVNKPAKKCNKCSKDLTPEDRSSWFMMDREGDNYEKPLHFISIYQASKRTGISICALRNACKKANMTIMRRKGGVQKFEVGWATTCFNSCPKTKKELLRQLND